MISILDTLAKKSLCVLKKIFLGMIFIVFMLVFVLPWLVPVPVLENTRPVYDLADQDSRFVNIDGWNIHYIIQGKGEPTIILLHGFGASLFSWRDVIGPLSSFGTVIAFDRPAFGLTERPFVDIQSDENFYASQNQAQLLLSLMENLQINQAILVGHSAGGTIAADFALQYPEKVRALILVAPAILESSGTPTWLGKIFRMPQLDRLGPLLARGFISRAENILELSWHNPSRISPEILEGYRKPLQAENWDYAFWRFITLSRPMDLREEISTLQMPVLVLSGNNDRIVPFENSRKVAQMIPTAVFKEIAACGHLPQEEQPEEFINQIRKFLNSVSGKSL